MTVRVVVVEDHPLYRRAVVSLVQDLDGFEVAGEYGDADSALAALEADAPDVVVLDLSLPGTSGLGALERLRAATPAPAVLVLTMSDEPPVLAAAVRAGARGYVVKGSEPEDIARAVEGVARGQVVFGEQVAGSLLAQASRISSSASFPGLTAREVEVLDLVARGFDNAAIAERLFLSPKTARNHVSSVLGKIGAESRAVAVARARDAGLGAG